MKDPKNKTYSNATTVDGDTIEIEISHFPAYEGYNIRKGYKNFAANPSAHCDFVHSVFSAAAVVLLSEEGITGESRAPLATVEAINYYLADWQTVDKIFTAVLAHNGISRDLEKAPEQSAVWEFAGIAIAKAVCAEVVKVLPPASEIFKQKVGE